MKSFSYVLTDAEGTNAAKILAVMSLGAKQGQTVEFQIEGADEDVAAAELEAFMKENL